MKLRTRITWICCLSVLFAMISTNLLIWNAQRENLEKEAQTQAMNHTYELVSSYQDAFSQFNTNMQEIPDEQLRYFFKNRNNEYDICIRYDTQATNYRKKEHAYFVYNHTVFTVQELLDLSYKFQNYDIESIDLTYEGGNYIVSRYTLYYDIELIHIEDINYVWDKLNRLTLFMVAITAFVLVGMSFIVTLVLRHTLKSLQELNVSAEDIAAGNYDRRVMINGRDEIAKLGATFNQMAEAVETRTKSLEDSERQKTMFMANLTHELKTPLAAIAGYAQTLLTVNVDEADREEALVYIDEECKRISRLAKKMMRLMELDSNAPLDRRMVSAKELFEKTKSLCNSLLDAKELTLECQYGEECFFVDQDLMLEVLLNLTENAAKASSSGQKIILSAADGRIEVRDFGCGIPKEEQEKILEPFYMIDKSRSRKNGGAGLGLALTALILKRHDILLTIESEVGEGTHMILQFV